MTQYDLAFMIASNAFRDKTDLAGKPYIEHLKRVSDKFPKESTHAVIGFLHDLLEDCPEWNEDSLRHLFSDDVVDAVVAMTKVKDESYDDYIKRVSENFYARKVKVKDLMDNMDITRIKEFSDKSFERLRKYHKAYKFLKDENN